MGTAVKHPVPDWVKPSFVIIDIRVSECPDVKNYTYPGLAQDALQLYPYGNIWHQRVNVTQFIIISLMCTS